MDDLLKCMIHSSSEIAAVVMHLPEPSWVAQVKMPHAFGHAKSVNTDTSLFVRGKTGTPAVSCPCLWCRGHFETCCTRISCLPLQPALQRVRSPPPRGRNSTYSALSTTIQSCMTVAGSAPAARSFSICPGTANRDCMAKSIKLVVSILCCCRCC